MVGGAGYSEDTMREQNGEKISAQDLFDLRRLIKCSPKRG
jgi:hypothetical protein